MAVLAAAGLISSAGNFDLLAPGSGADRERGNMPVTKGGARSASARQGARGFLVGLAGLCVLVIAPLPAVAATAGNPRVVHQHNSVSTQHRPGPVVLSTARQDVYTPFSHDWINSNGSHTEVISQGPSYYQDSQGWHQIDLHPTRGVDGRYRPRGSAIQVSLGASATDQVAAVSTSAGTISLSHPDASSVAPTLATDGFNLRYKAALSQGRDLLERPTPGGFEESVVLPNSSAPGSYQESFGVPSGVTATQDAYGVAFADSSGHKLAHYGFGYATDSFHGGAVTQVAVTLVSQHADTITVSVSVPPSWLASPARVFPITIDPTWSVYTGPYSSCGYTYSYSSYNSCDDYVASDNYYGQYSGYSYLRVGSPATCDDGGTYPNCDFTRDRMLLQFPVDSYGTAGGVCRFVSSATLNLDLESDVNPVGYASYHYYYLSGLASPFGNDTDWANQPATDSYGAYSSYYTAPGGPYSWDVTSIASHFFDCNEAAYGIEVTADAEQDPSAFRVFYSADYGYGYGPSLTVNYVDPTSAPQAVSVYPAAESANVYWSQPSYLGDGTISSYTVVTYLNGSYVSSTTVCGSCYSAAVSGLADNTTYGFEVYATDESGAGTYSSELLATTPIEPPGPPTSVSATTGIQTATVSWAPPTYNGGEGPNSYSVSAYASGYSTVYSGSLSSSASSYTFTGLANGVSYQYCVTDYNAAGSGTACTSPGPTANVPGPPGITSASGGVHSVSLDWTAAASNGATITSYTVTAYLASTGAVAGSVTVCGSCTTATVSGLMSGTAYNIGVYATNGVGSGPAALTSSPATTSVTDPSPPTSASASPGVASADVSWTPPSDSGGSYITSYSVTPYDLSTSTTLGATAISCGTASAPTPCASATIQGLTDGDSYYFAVAATNSVGTSGAVDTNNVTLNAPSGLNDLGNGDPSTDIQDCSAGAPVNCATGNFWHSFTDLSIPGRGPSLDLGRTYNSLAAAIKGPFGYGWSDTYSMSASVDGSGNVTITQENGSQVRFEVQSNGSYRPAGRILASLAKNADGTYTFIRKQKEIFTFSGSGQLDSIADLNGYQTTLSYSGGQLSAVTDPSGRQVVFAYNSSGLVSSVTDSGNRQVSYAYDANANLTSVTDTTSGVTSFTYDPAHHLLTMTDPRGGVVTNTYDSSARVSSQTDPLGRATTFAYSVAPDGATTTTVTDPKGYVEVETFAEGVLTSDTYGSGTSQAATWRYQYSSPTLEPTSETDPNGHLSSASYDALGDVLSTTDGLQRQTTHTYDSLGDLTSTTDPVGLVTSYVYDANANLLSQTQVSPDPSIAPSATTSYGYGDAAHPGDVTAVTNPDNDRYSYAYDANGDLISVTDPLGDETTATYDVLGRKLATVSPRGNLAGANAAQFTTSMTYDPAGDVLSLTDALGHTTTNTYDADHNLSTTDSPMGEVTQYSYDADNELTKIVRPDGTILSYGYDADGNQTAQTDGNGKTTTYGYGDPALPSRTTAVTDPLARTTSYQYDGVGNLVTVTNPAHQLTTDTYDAANQLVSVSYSDGTTPNVSYSYNGDGQVTQEAVGATFSRTYSYDYLGRLYENIDTKVVAPSPAPPLSQSVSYSHDLTDRLVGLSICSQAKTCWQFSRTYNSAGEMTSVNDGLGDATNFAYDADGNITSQSYPNGTNASYGYDNADQLTQTTDSGPGGSVFATLPSPRNGDGVITSDMEEGLPGTPTRAFSYDKNQRLTGVATTGLTNASYGYDSADNLASSQTTAGNLVLNHDAAHQLTSTVLTPPNSSASVTTNFGYDAQGNRTSEAVANLTNTASFTYDQANRLTTYDGPGLATINSQAASPVQTETFSYDGEGLRTDLGWDLAEGTPLIVLDEHGNAYLTGPRGLPVEQVGAKAAVVYYHHDALGSTRDLTDAAGTVVATYVYDAYGNSVGTATAVVNPFQFAGQYTDAFSGLIYMRSRWYDPATAQFVSRDPVESVTGQPYGYASDNPPNNVDPLGLCGDTAQFRGNSGLPSCNGYVVQGAHTTLRIYQVAAGEINGIWQNQYEFAYNADPHYQRDVQRGRLDVYGPNPNSNTLKYGLIGTADTNNHPYGRSGIKGVHTTSWTVAGQPVTFNGDITWKPNTVDRGSFLWIHWWRHDSGILASCEA